MPRSRESRAAARRAQSGAAARHKATAIAKPGRPRLIGKGRAVYWYNEKEFVVWRPMRSYRGSVDRPELLEYGEDSVRIVPVLEGKYLTATDFRAGREGAWITSAQSYNSYGLRDAKQLAPGIMAQPMFAREGRDWFYTKPGAVRELHRISLPAGKDERMGWVFPGLGSTFSVRRDGKEIAYGEYSRRTRFVRIDDVFK